MYRLGQRSKNKRKRIVWFGVGFVTFIVLSVFGVGLAKRWLGPNTTIKQTAAIVTKINTNNQPTKSYTEPNFTLSVPSDWIPTAGSQSPYVVYRWQSVQKTATTRQLEVYEDTIPQNYSVNRVLAISANGSQVSTLGSVSDNCIDFTKDVTQTATQTGVHAKWQGIDFLCDLNNYERNVVGTSSSNGINTVTLKGAVSGSHEFFFTYTDHNINPDYNIFYNILNSFKVK